MEEKDAANVRSDAPVPPECPVYYWEVEILSQGREGFIGKCLPSGCLQCLKTESK